MSANPTTQTQEQQLTLVVASEEADQPQYDPTIGEYVARTLAGYEVFGQTRAECLGRLVQANDQAVRHWQKSPEDRPEWECGCVLPEQHCSACDAAARQVYGADEIPF